MGRTYRNPPLDEAVCGFILSPDTKWDITVPGLVYERLKKDFPLREPRLYQEFEVVQDSEGIQHRINTSERLMLYTEDRRQFVQIGRLLIAVHALSPYPTWSGFKPKIELAWKSLCETVEVTGLERLGLRYINRIELADSKAKIEEFLEFYPFLGSRLPQETSSFHAMVEFAYEDGRDRCRVLLMPDAQREKSVVFLDIDYYMARPRGVATENALDWIETAHERVEMIFEGCITNSLRETFDSLEGVLK